MSTETETETTQKPNGEDEVTAEIRNRILSLILTLAKYLIFIYGVYCLCFLHWSHLWFLGLAILLAVWEEQNYKRRKKLKRRKKEVRVSERDVIVGKFKELPSWVMFPDIDRAEWVNTIIKQLWPTINNYLIKLLRMKIQKKIRKKFDNFRFEGLDFGSVCPRIDGVKVYDRNVARDEIVIDFDVYYDGDCDISFSIYGTEGSITDLQMCVELRIVLKPLIRKLPLVGGMQIFFLNTPEMDFNLEGIANIPGLADYMKKRIIKVLAKKIIFPNKIPISLSKSVEGQELICLEPEGVLRVHLSEAKDLEKRDRNVLGTGKSDPYAVISLGAQEYKTRIIDNTVDPKWDFWCEFYILDPAVQHLEIDVLDHDYKSDDFLGSTIVDISRIVHGKKTDQWISLERVKHGKIHLRFTWFTLSNDVRDLDAAVKETELLEVPGLSTALLSVYLELATNLPHPHTHKKPNPYASITVGKVTQESKSKKHTTAPVWEQGFLFLVRHPETETLLISIFDKKTQDKLDEMTFGIYQLIDKPKMGIEKAEFRMSNGSLVTMILRLRILKSDNPTDEVWTDSSDEEEEQIERKSSTKSEKSLKTPDVDFKITEKTTNSVQKLVEETEPIVEKMIAHESGLVRRFPSSAGSPGKYGLGQIQLTLRYSEPRQKLIVVVHKIANLPLKDPNNIPDAYVKLLLLPGGTHKKQKTKVVMNNCNPIFDQQFEYLLSLNDLQSQTLVVTVKSKIILALHSYFLGQAVLYLKDLNLSQSYTAWFDLCPEKDE